MVLKNLLFKFSAENYDDWKRVVNQIKFSVPPPPSGMRANACANVFFKGQQKFLFLFHKIINGVSFIKCFFSIQHSAQELAA